MAYEICIVEDFMNAWFLKDYSKLSEADFKIVYSEYQDTSGLFLTEDFEKQSYIQHLSQRINYVKIFVRLQRDFIKDFKMPFIRDFKNIQERYGYVLKWNEDLEDFEKQLKKVESREIKHESSLEESIKNLNESRSQNQKQEIPEEDEVKLKKTRISFLRMLNSLGKIGFKLDRKTTYVEELSLMIKQQMEENESYGNR